MDLDLEDIPEIDPVIPEPDFFDADDGAGSIAFEQLDTQILQGEVSSINAISNSAAATLASPSTSDPPLVAADVASNILRDSQQLDLKYDDEMCEFDEFLIGMEGMGGTGGSQVNQNHEQSQSSSKTPSQENQLENGINEAETEPEDGDENKSDCFMSASGPDTPESNRSKGSSAALTINLPAIPNMRLNLGSKKSTAKGSQDDGKQNSVRSQERDGSRSPSVSVASTRSSPSRSRGRKKRKLSSDFEIENDSDGESEEEETKPRAKKMNVTSHNTNNRVSGSGRMRRKVARYGHDEDDDESEVEYSEANEKQPNSRKTRGNKNGKVIRSRKDDSELDSSFSATSTTESLFEPVVRKSKSSNQKNWTEEENGTVLFTRSDGTLLSLPKVEVKVKRLTEKEIQKYTNVDPVLLEVCVDNFESVQAAVEGGAKRVELCSSLSEGGLTPSPGFFHVVKQSFPDLTVFVMIRPRGGDFVYSREEIDIMTYDIEMFKNMKADGFVFGVLTNGSEVDINVNRLLFEAAKPAECTFHRAFDKVSQPLHSLETIIGLGFKRILTSGQEATAVAGISRLKKFVDAARNRILIMPGAGVTEKNAGLIVKRTGVTEIHGSASVKVMSKMSTAGPSNSNKRQGRGRKSAKSAPAVQMGSSDDSFIKVTSAELVSRIIHNATHRRIH